jgi:uncharacterized protein YdhG (YjbR/CyaY superfamily)
MAKANFKSVDAYLASQPEDVQAKLELVRGAILRALPEAEEAIAYNIPTYKLCGGTVLHFAGWKRHYSLDPAGDALVARFRDELAPHRIERATLRFSLGEPVPVELLECIAKFRAVEAAERRARMLDRGVPGVSKTPGEEGE